MVVTKTLIVEGRDDEQVIYQFCNARGIENRSAFKVVVPGGVDEAISSLDVQLRASAEVVGIVVDADEAPLARWQQILGVVAVHGYSMPKEPGRGGFVCERPSPNRPKFGAWLMPDNQNAGALEEFLMSMIPKSDDLIGRARATVDEIPNAERRFPPNKTGKALVHTWLAWQEEPGTPLGLGITRKYFSDSASGDDFEKWLRAPFFSVNCC